MIIENKIDEVKEILKDKEVAIAFSGGADSTLMAYLAKDVCKRVLAITIDNNILPPSFIENTEKFCRSLNIPQEIIFEDFYNHEDIISNNHDRCFLCRKEMYRHIFSVANDNGFSTIVDGTNISDLVIDRPGILINYENDVLSPFVKARLTSKEIHEYLNRNNIPYSSSTTCLATRIPFDDRFTKDAYERISDSEEFVYNNSDCKIVKVRENSSTATVEVDSIENLIDNDKLGLITTYLKGKGYEKVLLNLTEIESDEDIHIEFSNNEFSYMLPYGIDLEKTFIDDENIDVYENGLIVGRNFESYDSALNSFMDILPMIRRQI
ncbi:MAG: ATP-binding protein [Methanobrevibacter sp.]|uniref:ATP-binding protein n=1 Tax=Methanobrevibacter sp. TaxID=66852 RepID=UPI0026E0BEC8|nr:ATP-binding protein [Methanobrevibacter sp.]MDO5848222.1 ATP-binding protein [Methanobrevibacter sp.]